MRKFILKTIAFAALIVISQAIFAENVPQMMKTMFHQKSPFNNACPNNYAAGCGAIAIAQILKYHEQPEHGYGNLVYKSSNVADSLRLDFETMTFDWDNVLNEYHVDEYSDVQADAVAQVVYACGAAMFSNYGNSTAVNNYAKMLFGLQHYLHISPDSRYVQRKFYSTEEWIAMLNENLYAGHPVFYRGSWLFDGETFGHMYVIDGLNEDGEYHVNFGHANSQDKFTSLQVINQSGTFPGGRPVCYNASQTMVINCFPTPSFDSYPRQRCISDEAIILNGDFRSRETDIALGEAFSLSCKLRNVCNEAATIKFGWALVKDKERICQLTEKSYKLSAGNTFKESVQSSVTLPNNLEDGEYELKLYSYSDLLPEWQPVMDNAPSTVYVTVNNGKAHIIAPDNHAGDPELYLLADLKEVDTEMSSTVPGRTFLLNIVNRTTNNFENIIRLDIETGQGNFTYDVTLPIYSQTTTEFHVTVPLQRVDLEGKDILSVKASYYYDMDDNFIQLCVGSNLNMENLDNEYSKEICIYNLNGNLLRKLKRESSNNDYMPYLQSLPQGIYLIKEGIKTVKIVNP